MSEWKSFHSAKESLLQSAVNHTLIHERGPLTGISREHPAMESLVRAMTSSSHREQSSSSTLEDCATLAVELAWAKLSGNTVRATELENELKFGSCDPGWGLAIEAYLKAYGLSGKTAPVYQGYKQLDDYVYPLPSAKKEGELVVGVLGDWGTGEPVAKQVLTSLMSHQPDVIIHVGDVYYAGTEAEQRDLFLDVLAEARSSQPVAVYNLPGNHDYYSGGQPFYDVLAKLNEAPNAPDGTPIQEASYFCLRNEHWQLQGMDTGYFDHDLFTVDKDITHLHPSETAWHLDKLESAGDRRVLFFSHHQLFSAFSKIGGKSANEFLLKDFAEPLKQGQIAGWWWGHEHLLEIYEPYLGLPKGRCIGYSAFPVLNTKEGYEVVSPEVPLTPDPQNPAGFVELGVSDEVFNHGYAVLKLRPGGEESEAEYYELPGDGSSSVASLRFSEIL